MRCPKCSNEVCNQRVCPYCGATVYLEDSSLASEKSRYGGLRQQIFGKTESETQEDLLRKVQKLEIRINLILVLNVALFVLMILLLVMLLSAM